MITGESSGKGKKGVLIVDDHALMRVGLRSVLELQDDLVVVGEAGNGVQAVQLAKKLKPDIVIMDLIMPEMDGAEATREILKLKPCPRVVVLSSYGSSQEMKKAIGFGASATLQKESATRDILKAIRKVIDGGRYFEQEILDEVQDLPTDEDFTDRQRAVLGSMAAGKSNKEIAEALGITRHGVDKHVAAIFQKLGCSSRSEAVSIATACGLV